MEHGSAREEDEGRRGEGREGVAENAAKKGDRGGERLLNLCRLCVVNEPDMLYAFARARENYEAPNKVPTVGIGEERKNPVLPVVKLAGGRFSNRKEDPETDPGKPRHMGVRKFGSRLVEGGRFVKGCYLCE